jgi:hypothetical protein
VNVGLIIAIFNTFRNSPLNRGMLFNGNHVITTISVLATTNIMMIKHRFSHTQDELSP